MISLAHDFFTPEPTRKGLVFLLRMIWSDKYCVKNLPHLRDAVDKDTKLLIVDNIISYTSNETLTKDIRGTPPELRPNQHHCLLH
jgi:hypothetical protein